MLRDLVLNTRSYRRFHEEVAINMGTLRELVDLARNTASARNLQPLRYILSCDRLMNARIFPNLFWAMDLKDWPGPVEGERPSAYIVILSTKEGGWSFVSDCDLGIAAQTILLGATEKGFGGCMLASIRKEGLQEIFNVPDGLDFRLVIALGRPKEKVVLETVGPDGKITYWRESDGTHHVPKRRLEDIVIADYGA